MKCQNGRAGELPKQNKNVQTAVRTSKPKARGKPPNLKNIAGKYHKNYQIKN